MKCAKYSDAKKGKNYSTWAYCSTDDNSKSTKQSGGNSFSPRAWLLKGKSIDYRCSSPWKRARCESNRRTVGRISDQSRKITVFLPCHPFLLFYAEGERSTTQAAEEVSQSQVVDLFLIGWLVYVTIWPQTLFLNGTAKQ